MYKVLIDGKVAYRAGSKTYALTQAQLELETGFAGKFTFTIPATNPMYDLIEPLVSKIQVFRDDEELFYGSIRSMTNLDFQKAKTYECLSAMSWLSDTVQPQKEFHDYTVRQFLSALINEHNKKASADKQFEVGTVTITDSNDSLYRYSNFENTLECIRDKLVNRLGGHLRVRHEGNKLILDYLSIEEFGDYNQQPIEFGLNLLDYSETKTVDDIITCLIPRGATKEVSDAEKIGNLDIREDIKSVNGGIDFLVNQTALDHFGAIWGVAEWDDVHAPANLKAKGQEYLVEKQYEDLTLTLQAADLSALGQDYEAFHEGDRILCSAKPFGMHIVLPVMSLTINLLDPAGNTLTLTKATKQTFTSSVSSGRKKDRQDAMETKQIQTDALNSAYDNITSMMTGSKGGYKITEYDEEGRWLRDLYLDTPDKNTAQRVLQINKDGIGGSVTGINGPYHMGITIDGQIVGEQITAGSVTTDKLAVTAMKDIEELVEVKDNLILNGYNPTTQDTFVKENILVSDIDHFGEMKGENCRRMFETWQGDRSESFDIHDACFNRIEIDPTQTYTLSFDLLDFSGPIYKLATGIYLTYQTVDEATGDFADEELCVFKHFFADELIKGHRYSCTWTPDDFQHSSVGYDNPQWMKIKSGYVAIGASTQSKEVISEEVPGRAYAWINKVKLEIGDHPTPYSFPINALAHITNQIKVDTEGVRISAEKKIDDALVNYYTKSEIDVNSDGIKLWVKENPAYINPNLVTNGYDPLVWRDEAGKWAELVNDPLNEDPLLRHCFKTYRKQGSGNSWWPYASNAFAFDPSKSYAVSFYVSDVTGSVGSVFLNLELYNSITGPYNSGTLVRKRSHTFNVSDIPEDGVLKFVFLSSNSQAGDAQAKMAYIAIGVGRESGDTTSEISCKINRIKVEESDTCTPWQECNSSQSQIYSLINVTKDQILMEIRPSSSNLLTNTYEPKDPSYTHVAESHGGSNAFDVWKYSNSTTKWKAYTNRFDFNPKKKYILSFRIKNWQGNASDNAISHHLMMGTASSKGIESVSNVVVTIKQSTSGTGIKTWIYDPNRTGSWTDGKTYGEYYAAQNVKTAYIEFEPIASTSESAGAYIDHIRFEEGDTPGQWTEYDKNVNDLYTMFKMTEDSIMLQAENIRLKAETLVWDATNSSLTEDGTLTARNGKFNNCSMTGNMTTTNGNYSTTINGGAAKFKYKNKESGSIWSDSSNRLRINGTSIWLDTSSLMVYHSNARRDCYGKTGVVTVRAGSGSSGSASQDAYFHFVNGIFVGATKASSFLNVSDWGSISIYSSDSDI